MGYNNLMKTLDHLSKVIEDESAKYKRVFDSIQEQLSKLPLANLEVSFPQIVFPDIKEYFTLSPDVKAALKNYSFILACTDVSWPLFIEDQVVKDYVLKLQKEGLLCEDEVRSFVIDYYKQNDLSDKLSTWLNTPVIKEARKVILLEGINCYNNSLYYGACSIFVCQMSGIISDILEYMEANNVMFSSELSTDVGEYRNWNDQKLKKAIRDIENGSLPTQEKDMLAYIILSQEINPMFWYKVLEYINNIVYTSQAINQNNNQPCRNKICHGEQLNFGTQEHCLKAVFTIDLLCKLASTVFKSIDNVSTQP